MEIKRHVIRLLGMALYVAVISCTDFQEESVPTGLSVDAKELSFSIATESHPLTVTSGKGWDIPSMPSWMSVQSVTGDVASSYKWSVVFSARENNDYNREGTIVIKTSDESVDVAVKQEGKKGEYVPVSSVSLSSTDLTLTEGDTYELVATINPINASEKTATWSSSNTSVSTVSSSGIVTANTVGTATITVKTDDGGKTASCSVTVKPVSVSSVTLDKETLTLKIGETYSLTATVLPENAANKRVSWSSSNTSVATVDPNGKVSAISVGSSIITVTTEDGGKKATCSVYVNPIPVTGVSLNKTSMTLLIGGTEKLTATVSPSNATNKNVTWSSSNTDVATVDSNGNLSAISVGTAIITVKTEDGGKTATCSVTVNPIAVTSVSLDQTSLTMTVGDTQTLTATVSPSNATDKSVSWSSNNTSVATVSFSGVVTAKAAGSATITVTTNDGGKKATCSVTVKAQTVSVTGVSLDKTSMSMIVGDTQTLTATVTPSNASNKSVTWSSSNTSVATVSSSGLVTAKAAGSATITVTTNDGGKKATCLVTVSAAIVSVTGVSLDKTSLSMTVGETQTLTATISPSNATDKSVIWSSNNTSVASVSSSGLVTAKAAGSATIIVTTNDGGKTALCAVTVTQSGPEAVDLGLSVKWASYNVGASKPEDYGDYFAWGETSPKDDYNFKTYKWCNGSYASLTKYNTKPDKGIFDNKTQLDLSDDAARANWGGKWRMPTEAEWTELQTNCTWTWTTQNGVSGHKVTSKVNGNFIFLPVAGYLLESTLYDAGSGGYYWSSSLSIDYPWTAYTANTREIRCEGLSIRPVYGESTTVPVSGVSLDKTSLSMTVGDIQALTATVTPSNATNKSVTWSSNNTSVATVSSSGVVTAKAAGSATITVVTLDGNKKATCSVTVSAATIPVTGVSLDRTSLSMTVGDTQTLTATVAPSNATNKSVTWSSSNTSIATVSSSGVVTAKAAGAATVTVSTNDGGKTALCAITVSQPGPEAVDLGLSVKWASCNVGASSPEEYGNYYAWGEIETKNDYDWKTYKWCNGSLSTLTKYNTKSYRGTVDNKTQLDLSDDAARANWGEKWRMPTMAEQDELRTKCTWIWTTQNGVNGYLVTSKKNGNSVFLPAAGYRDGTTLYDAGSGGYYWSSALLTGDPCSACNVGFGSSFVYMNYYARNYGQSVRPVTE